MHVELRYQLLKRLEAAPDSSQRDLSGWLGVSLGKLNACLRCLIEEGQVVANDLSDNGGLSGPRYRVTRRGRASRAESAVRCLQEKQALISTLKSEIASLEAELKHGNEAGGGVREG
ncbi:MAG: winged helix-turn-helix transcriptional regulator [Pseudomonadota bacterium]